VLGDNIADFSNFWNNLPVAFLGIARKPIQAIPSKTLINPPKRTSGHSIVPGTRRFLPGQEDGFSWDKAFSFPFLGVPEGWGSQGTENRKTFDIPIIIIYTFSHVQICIFTAKGLVPTKVLIFKSCFRVLEKISICPR
jgi:hypothetical protein